MDTKIISGFLDGEGRVTKYPAKRRRKIMVLFYLGEKVEEGREYTEREINELLCAWHTFADPATLRREMYDYHILDRDARGTCYTKAADCPMLEELLERYGG